MGWALKDGTISVGHSKLEPTLAKQGTTATSHSCLSMSSWPPAPALPLLPAWLVKAAPC